MFVDAVLAEVKSWSRNIRLEQTMETLLQDCREIAGWSSFDRSQRVITFKAVCEVRERADWEHEQTKAAIKHIKQGVLKLLEQGSMLWHETY